MGQRLSVGIRIDGQLQANAYYHWSAYTQPALQYIEEILKAAENSNEQDPVVFAVKVLEATGAGLTGEEMPAMKERSNLTFRESFDRNDGLIAITQKGMDETDDWAESLVVIDFDDEEIYFGVLTRESKEDYLEYYEVTEAAYKQLPLFLGEYRDLTFDAFPAFKQQMLAFLRDGHEAVRNDDGDVIAFVV